MLKRVLILLAAAAMALPVAAQTRTLRVLTHSSFAASPSVIRAFEQANDVKLQFISAGDAGETLNKAILARGNPIADVLYGVDNTFLSRALEADILEPYDSPALAQIPDGLDLDPTHRMLPVDYGYVDLNYDPKYFADKGLAVPRTLEDLTQSSYIGLLVAENPATSSPGLAFLLATIARFGQTSAYTWQDYWKDLRKNDVLVVNDWNDAYYSEFSATGKGTRPIVVSYATSPAAELYYASDPKPPRPPTANLALEDGSFLQVEFVGVLKGAREPDLARKFVDFMLSGDFQKDIPLQMWVYPANPQAPLPDLFQKWAPIPARPLSLGPAAIDAGRDGWIRTWTQLVLR